MVFKKWKKMQCSSICKAWKRYNGIIICRNYVVSLQTLFNFVCEMSAQWFLSFILHCCISRNVLIPESKAVS